MALVFKNFAGSTLVGNYDATATLVSVADGSVFPDVATEGEFVCVIEDVNANREVVRCTGRTGEQLTLLRGQEGTTARAFVSGDTIELRWTAGAIKEFFVQTGIDGGSWETPDPNRNKIQIRRNCAEPAAKPGDLYEGEIAVNMATATPRLFIGPCGGDGDDEGIAVIPLVISDTSPANPYHGLLYYDRTGKTLLIWDEDHPNGADWYDVLAKDVTAKSYATVAYVDAEIAAVKALLSAPSGTKLVFQMDSLPPGWVRETANSGNLLMLTNSSTGGSFGSWTISGLYVVPHAITLDQMPRHDHLGGNHTHHGVSALGAGTPAIAGGSNHLIGGIPASGIIVHWQGGNQAHNHSITHNGGWRPKHTMVTIGRKT